MSKKVETSELCKQFGIPMATPKASQSSKYELPKAQLGIKGDQPVYENWGFIARSLFKEQAPTLMQKGYLDLDEAYKQTKDPLILKHKEQLKDIVAPFCGRVMVLGMFKIKNKTWGYIKTTKNNTFLAFANIVSFNSMEFCPDEIYKELLTMKAQKKTQEDMENFFVSEVDQAQSAGQYPFVIDVQIYFDETLKSKIEPIFSIYSETDVATTQDKILLGFIGKKPQWKSYTKNNETKDGFVMNLDDVFLFKP